MAKAQKLPSGTWRVQANKTVNGKLVRKSFTNASKRAAEREALIWQDEVTKETAIDNITLAEGFERYISAKERVLSPATIRVYKVIQKAHFQELMHIKIEDLTEEQIQRAVNSMAINSSPKTVRNAYGLLTAVLGMLRFDLKLKISLPPKVKNEIYIPDDKMVKRLLEISKGTPFYIPILLAAFGGLRRGEICALSEKDFIDNKVIINKALVRDSSGMWHTKTPKTFSGNRRVELPPFVKTAIIANNGTIYNGNPNSLTTGFNNMLKRNNMPDFRFHDLRHYYVSSLFDMGLPEKYIIAQVGHSSSNITKRVYDHIMQDKQSQYADAVAANFQKIYG